MPRESFFSGAQSKYLQAARHCWSFYICGEHQSIAAARDACSGTKTQQKWCTSAGEEELGPGHVCGGHKIRLIKSRAGWLIDACHIQSRLTPIALRTSVEPSAFCIKHATQQSHSDGEQAKRLPSSQFPLSISDSMPWDAGQTLPLSLAPKNCFVDLAAAWKRSKRITQHTTPPLAARKIAQLLIGTRAATAVSDVRCVFPELIVRREPETVKYCN